MIPTHVAVIMDGNGRWARRQLQERTFGHEQGVAVLESIVDECINCGIRFLTVYAFSTENWSRPPAEVSFLFELLSAAIQRVRTTYRERNVKVQFCGERTTQIPETVIAAMNCIEQDTAACTGLILSVCFNYGGHTEIAQACRSVLADCLDGDAVENIKTRLQMPIEQFIQQIDTHLYANLPPVDLLIRTGCEKRLSNFLPWHLAYAEIIFSDLLWPEFSVRAFKDCLDEFASRTRRFGGVQLPPMTGVYSDTHPHSSTNALSNHD